MSFPETNWSILAAATMNGGVEERDALDELCRAYWKPVANFIKSRGAPAERVDDLTQDFFVQLMTKSFFKKADPGKGKFRSFILGSLRYFLADDARRNLAQKKGGHLQRTELTDEVPIAEEGDAYFDRAWAETIFEKIIAEIEKETIARRGEGGWEWLRKFLPGPQTAPSYDEVAEHLGLTVSATKSEVFRLRDKFRNSLRAEVGRTVDAPHEIDEELAHLRAALEKGSKAL